MGVGGEYLGDLINKYGSEIVEKGFERIKNLQNIINNQSLSADDLKIVNDLLQDLQDALKGVNP